MTTTDCRELEGQLVDLLDGKLPPAVELRMHAHAESCASCRASLSRWQRALPALRQLEPAPPAPLALRRMELAIARELEAQPATGSGGHQRLAPLRLRWALLGAAAIGALVLVGTRFFGQSPARPVYGRLETMSGQVLVDGKALPAGAELGPPANLALPGPGQLTFSLGRQAKAELRGPGQLTLQGDARAVRVRLQSGELALALGRRQPDESFTVETRHGRVEVRGTRFAVGFAGQGAWVRVDEGLVAAFRAGESEAHAVGAGETFWLAAASPPAPPADQAPSAVPQERPVALEVDAPQPPAAADCETATARARRAMRAGQPLRALHLLDDRGQVDTTQASQRCRDEIGYLRAEALRAAGRLRDAIAAYVRLDRHGAEPAMRQNALFAAGELEERLGRHAAAYQRFESALAVAPSGGLREEAMAGAMHAAWAARDAKLARPAAERYLGVYANGSAAHRARQILLDTDGGQQR
jgi:tetratricopeptide (TPR) repeat protein